MNEGLQQALTILVWIIVGGFLLTGLIGAVAWIYGLYQFWKGTRR